MKAKSILKKCSFNIITIAKFRDFFPLKDFFKRTDECHAVIKKEIEGMKATVDGEDKWMLKEKK